MAKILLTPGRLLDGPLEHCEHALEDNNEIFQALCFHSIFASPPFHRTPPSSPAGTIRYPRHREDSEA